MNIPFRSVFQRMRRRPASSRLSVAYLFLFLFFLLPSLALAAEGEKTSPGARPVPDSVLAGMRGGFSWGGVDFSFGIESSTFVNGTLMVKTILQTVGNELYAATGVNPFSNGGSPSGKNALSVVNSPGNSMSSGNNLPNGLSVVSQTILSPDSSSLSATQKTYSNVVQIQPADQQGHVQNLVVPTSFDNASGIISVLQNAASNLVIHNIVTMNGTVSNVANITHVLSLNGMLQSSRFLNR